MLYNALFVKRNEKWTRHIEEILTKEKGVVFVGVGTGHVLGRDSLINMLKTKGHAVMRH